MLYKEVKKTKTDKKRAKQQYTRGGKSLVHFYLPGCPDLEMKLTAKHSESPSAYAATLLSK